MVTTPSKAERLNGLYERLSLARPINAAGYLTGNGASPVEKETAAAAALAMTGTFIIDRLQDRASAAIAAATGAEAGYVAACAAAGITLSIAGIMTAGDRKYVRQLPDASGMKFEVVLPAGHDCDFGARIGQMIRLAGARPVLAGTSRRCTLDDIGAAIGNDTAAGLYVTSNHVDPAAAPPFEDFAALLRSRGVPVIADCAAENSLRAFIGSGADIAIYSAHKVRRAPTAGIVAGRADLIAHCRAQDHGIGRPMKVGKEGIVGAIVALQRWAARAHARIEDEWRRRSGIAVEALAGAPHLRAVIEEDPNGNPVPRTLVTMDGACPAGDAVALMARLADEDPPCLLRATENDRRSILLDPRSLTDAEMRYVCGRIRSLCEDRDGRQA